eukprot:gene828-1121_t
MSTVLIHPFSGLLSAYGIGLSSVFAARQQALLKPLAATSAEAVDALILEEFSTVFGGPPPPVLERWTGTYAWARDHNALVDSPLPGVRLVMVTTGAGASTGFALGEEVVADLLVIFDWAGTMVDFGCRAPVEALLTAFGNHGVTLEETTARADMGR